MFIHLVVPCHHDLKLLEIYHAVAVTVDAGDHLPALVDGALVAEARHHHVQLLRGDGAVTVDVKNGKSFFEILKNLVGFHTLRV